MRSRGRRRRWACFRPQGRRESCSCRNMLCRDGLRQMPRPSRQRRPSTVRVPPGLLWLLAKGLCSRLIQQNRSSIFFLILIGSCLGFGKSQCSQRRRRNDFLSIFFVPWPARWPSLHSSRSAMSLLKCCRASRSPASMARAWRYSAEKSGPR